jgi:hypothetical protein
MRIAYLILAHKNPMQLKRLINVLRCDTDTFYIHIDAKVNLDAFKFLEGLDNVHLIKKRVDIHWGAYSMVKATLNGLEEIVQSDTGCDYVSLISGQDYPIKNNKEIHEFLELNKGKEYLYFIKLPTWELPYGGMDRVEYYYNYDNEVYHSNEYEIEMKVRGIKRKFIEGMIPYHGSQWWSLTIQCVNYILELINNNKDIINFYRYSKFPDEQFFQTVIMNSPFSDKTVCDNLRLICWPSFNWKEVDWYKNPPHPLTLTVKDFNSIKKSQKFYARKLDEDVDADILDLIDTLILGRISGINEQNNKKGIFNKIHLK